MPAVQGRMQTGLAVMRDLHVKTFLCEIFGQHSAQLDIVIDQ
jgi:hypothetical protein